MTYNSTLAHALAQWDSLSEDYRDWYEHLAMGRYKDRVETELVARKIEEAKAWLDLAVKLKQ